MAAAEELDRALRNRQLRNSVRMMFEGISDGLIVRLMPSRELDVTEVEFFRALCSKIAQMPGHTERSVVGMRASCMILPGLRSNETGMSLRPGQRMANNNPWPSVTIEVGYSQNLSQLRLDAQWWLIYSANQTRFVVLLHVARNPNRLNMECWSMSPPQRITRNTPPQVPRCGQEFSIDSAGVITSIHAQLTIPYTSIFDLPHPNSADIIFTHAELSDLALWIYTQWP